jgi:hypothetical protein
MINLELLLSGVAVASIATGLVTEAVKRCLTELKVKYHANILSGIVSVVVSAAIGVGYVAFSNAGFSAQSIVGIVGLASISWLCSMIGYDKVKQAIDQIKNIKKG